jgi:hypothetical protein
VFLVNYSRMSRKLWLAFSVSDKSPRHVSKRGSSGNAVWPEHIIRSHHGSMAHHKPWGRYDARYVNPQFNQYRYNDEMSFRTQN